MVLATSFVSVLTTVTLLSDQRQLLWPATTTTLAGADHEFPCSPAPPSPKAA
jgi:hypothetical protein